MNPITSVAEQLSTPKKPQGKKQKCAGYRRCGIEFVPKRKDNIWHNKRCSQKARAERDREKLNARSRKWAELHPDKVIEAGRKWRRNNPEKQAAIDARWRKNNPEKVKLRNKRGSTSRHAKLAELKRLKNVERVDLLTGLRLSLAAYLSLEGVNPHAMRNEIYPDAKDAADSIKKLLGNYRPVLEAEKKRLTARPEHSRRDEVADLRIRLYRELNRELH